MLFILDVKDFGTVLVIYDTNFSVHGCVVVNIPCAKFSLVCIAGNLLTNSFTVS